MKFSLRFNNDHPVTDYVRWAQAAESYGFDQIWISNDLFLRSAPVILTAIALATKRIQFGTCILNPYSINPAEIAMFAATIDEIAPGRFNLGLASGAADFLGWIGIPQEKPRTALVESIMAIRKLLTGEQAASQGEFLQWSSEAYLRFGDPHRIPIYIGAMSPKMLIEIGRIADGGLPLLFPPEYYQTVAPIIQSAALAANRDPASIDIAACIWCSLSEDQSLAEDALKEKVAYYGHALSDTILGQLGLQRSDFNAIEHAIMKERNIAKAKAFITPPMLRIGIAGTPQQLNNRLEGLVAAGVRHISFGPPLGPDIDLAIRMIGNQVIPHFR
jgi:5,10-methylenetetrahydromethanopterin reductase